MNKVISWVLGLTMGGTVGALVVMLLVPITREQIMSRLKSGFEETMNEARLASEQRRLALEAELSEMQNQRSLPE